MKKLSLSILALTSLGTTNFCNASVTMLPAGGAIPPCPACTGACAHPCGDPACSCAATQDPFRILASIQTDFNEHQNILAQLQTEGANLRATLEERRRISKDTIAAKQQELTDLIRSTEHELCMLEMNIHDNQRRQDETNHHIMTLKEKINAAFQPHP